MLLSEPIKEMRLSGKRVSYITQGASPIYIGYNELRSYLPALAANPDGSGSVAVGQPVRYVRDLTGNGNDAVAPNADNAPIVSDDGGLLFDGVTNYLNIPPSPSLDFEGKRYLSVEAWAKSGVAGWNSFWHLVSRYNQFILGPNSREMAYLLIVQGGSWMPVNYGSVDWGQDSDLLFDPQQWHHYCGVADTVAGYLKLYVDGQERAHFSIPTNPIVADSGPIHLGHREGDVFGTRHYKGSMADVRIWDRVRTPAEIARDFNRRLLGHETGLVAYYPF